MSDEQKEMRMTENFKKYPPQAQILLNLNPKRSSLSLQIPCSSSFLALLPSFSSMAAFTSIAPNLSATFDPKFVPSSKPVSDHCSFTFSLGSIRFSGQTSSTPAIPISRGLQIQNTATKPAKSPAEEEWKIKREILLQKKVRSVDVKEALRLQNENNFVILDVRPEAEFKEGHPPAAVNIQVYRLIKEWTAWDIARRVAFAFFGIFSGTEENPEFLQIVESKMSKDAKIIVACSSGGTMKPTQNLPEGQQSRSLIAAYLLVLNGYTNVFHLEGGLYSWFKEGLPAVAEDD